MMNLDRNEKLLQNELLESKNNAKNKKILVSGNAGDEKNLHPGGRKFFFNQFN